MTSSAGTVSRDGADCDRDEALRAKQKASVGSNGAQGEISPVKPAAFLGFFKPKAKHKANDEGEISMTNPNAFLDFFKPVKWIRHCPAPREVVFTPPTPPSPGIIHPAKKKKKKDRKKKSRDKKKRRGWMCEQEQLPPRAARQENFLNLTPEELRNCERNAERARIRAETKLNNMYRSYIKGIEYKKGHIMREMKDLVTITDERRHLKYANLYEQWRKQVYEYIQTQVEASLSEMSPDYIKDKLRWYHYQYMAIANKQIILRDYPRPDYDPFESLNYLIKYSTFSIVDPVKHDLTKENLEKQFMGEQVWDKPQLRETLALPYWPKYHYRGTVHGHLEADEEDGSQIVIQQPEKYFSHDLMYNKKFVGVEYVNAEFPRGKCIVPNQGLIPENHLDKPVRKAIVYGVECLTQPKLKIW